MNVVLDTNCFLSGLVTGEAAPTVILARRSAEEFRIVASNHFFDGVARALKKPYWQQRQDRSALEARLASLVLVVPSVEPVEGIHGVAPDDEDDLILATAIAANADFLVTGDKGLLALGEFRGIPIMSPREFLERLDQQPATTLHQDKTVPRLANRGSRENDGP